MSASQKPKRQPPKGRGSAAGSRDLVITALSEYGFGQGQKAGQTLSVARTVPGDKVLVGPPASRDKWTRANLLRVVEPGPGRVPSGCDAFERGCGGCQWLHVAYSEQLIWKERNLTKLLRERAGFRGRIDPLEPASVLKEYRNKLSLKNVNGRWVFLPETGDLAMAPRECQVQTSALQIAWSVLRTKTAPSFMEQLHLRSNDQGQLGVHAFIHEKSQGMDREADELRRHLRGVVGVGATKRSGYRVWGEPFLEQTVGALRWAIPHNGFFQTNADRTPQLLQTVVREVAQDLQSRVLDLYCGAGFFGLAVAGRVGEVVGIEENPSSVDAAQKSAQLSGVGRARFLAGDVGVVLDTLPAANSETVLVDPPRTGLSPQARAQLVRRRPRRIVYVSCYPASLARDLTHLHQAGWRDVSCTPVDMFPHTSHVEVVVTLEK